METPSEKFFLENTTEENRADMEMIGAICCPILKKRIALGIKNPKTVIAMYLKILESICTTIRKREANDSSFSLNIANRLVIGYTSTDDEEDEKFGNFQAYMQHMDAQEVAKEANLDESSEDSSGKTVELATQWNAINIKEQATVLKEVAAEAKQGINDVINTTFASIEFVIPFFCIVHSQIVEYVKTKQQELSKEKDELAEYSLDVCGWYTISIENVQKDGESDITQEILYDPGIAMKLFFKNDMIASKEG